MAFIPATNVLQVEIRGEFQADKPVENVLYFLADGAITAPEVENLFDFIEDEFLAATLAVLSGTYDVHELYATDLTTATAPTYSRVFSPPLAGAGVSPGMPGSLACCISFRSANRGRTSRGRNYVTGLMESTVANDNVDTGLINALVAAYELFLGGGTFPAYWAWVILSRFLDGAPRASGLAQPVIDVLSTDTLVDAQRNRVKD